MRFCHCRCCCEFREKRVCEWHFHWICLDDFQQFAKREAIFSSLYASMLVDVINLSHNNHKESLLGARLKWNCTNFLIRMYWSLSLSCAYSASSRYGFMLLLMMMLSSHNNMACENFSTVYLPTDSECSEVCYLLCACVCVVMQIQAESLLFLCSILRLW